ncbi:hypothetical protein SAMN05216312_1207 [Cohnella sp. OV330]|uniref:DUF6953 family protein n=1 Tax=Cohnella sp. OV330 TaxID=1855288 RepID=UPI0008E19D0D|nr:hypothetical protein [Cohnella sp. OV330]SFB62037.1 hypothetical protein SAMN05216312_1207 [Cohnella sp. OV330]
MENTAQDVADWMVSEIRHRGMLKQEEAVAYIREQFGERFVFVNERGHTALDREVVKAFRKLHGGRVAWDRDGFFWGWT